MVMSCCLHGIVFRPSAVSTGTAKIREKDFDLISAGPAKSATAIVLCNQYKIFF